VNAAQRGSENARICYGIAHRARLVRLDNTNHTIPTSTAAHFNDKPKVAGRIAPRLVRLTAEPPAVNSKPCPGDVLQLTSFAPSGHAPIDKVLLKIKANPARISEALNRGLITIQELRAKICVAVIKNPQEKAVDQLVQKLLSASRAIVNSTLGSETFDHYGKS
jgi:hypothetical protein